MTSVTASKRKTLLLIISLVFLAGSKVTANTLDVTVTKTEDEIDMDLTKAGGGNLKIDASAVLTPGDVDATVVPAIGAAAAAAIDVTWSNLNPNTAYKVVLTNVVDDADNPNPLTSDNSDAAGKYEATICTLPQPITVGSVVDANTSLTQVKITWTNVASSGGVEVARGATKQVITDPTVNEYIFTGLTAGDPQMCFVTTLGSNLCSAEKAATAKTIGECDTRTELNVVNSITHDTIDLDLTAAGGGNAKVSTSAMLTPGDIPATMDPSAVGTAAADIDVTWSSLTPNTKYTVTITSVLDANDKPLLTASDSDLSGTYSAVFCTLPQDIVVADVVDAETNSTQVKISWTNVPPSGGVTIVRASETVEITDPTVTEHVFTGLSAGDTQSCSVTNKGSGYCIAKNAATPKIINCDTKHTDLVVAETVTTNKITLVYTLANNQQFAIGTNVLTQGVNPVSGTGNDGTTPAASHTFTWDNLDANTRYDLTLGNVADATNTVYGSKSWVYCTKPEAATAASDQGLVDATTNEITIKWTNPSSQVGGIKVSWGTDFETTLTDSTLTEYTFKESAPGTPLVAGQSGTCKIYIVGSGACAGSESDALEIVDCNTKSSVTRFELSISLLLLNLVRGLHR